MIELERVSKRYGRRGRTVDAVREISLSIGPGVWAVVGPNGAGKTTLMGLILGFLRPTGGAVRIGGAPPRIHLRTHGAAYLPERFSLPPEWPVRDAVEALARLDGGDEPRHRAARAIQALGLDEHRERRVGDLSRGLNQRVGLAQALATDRDVVVLDEPTEGLDPLWRIRFRELVEELRSPERVILIASHDLTEVERLADHVVVLADGRVAEVMEPDDDDVGTHRAGPRPAGPLRYRRDVQAPDETVLAIFPNVARLEAGVAEVPVADEVELSDRLAALLERGALIRAVTPVRTGLEERVKKRLEGEGS